MEGVEYLPSTGPLGDRLQVFRPMLGNVIAGFILCLLLTAGGLTAVVMPLRNASAARFDLPLTAEEGDSWLFIGLVCLIGTVFAGTGISFGLYSRELRSRRVEVHEHGFRQWSGGSAEDVPWADVRLIRETVCHEHLPVLYIHESAPAFRTAARYGF